MELTLLGTFMSGGAWSRVSPGSRPCLGFRQAISLGLSPLPLGNGKNNNGNDFRGSWSDLNELLEEERLKQCLVFIVSS